MDKQKFLYHLAAVLILTAISFAYFFPVLDGKKLAQHDVIQVMSMLGEVNKHYNEDGRILKWTNSQFGGMPAYQIKMEYPKNLLSYISTAVRKIFIGETHMLFLLLIGMYVALYFLTGNVWVSVVGAIGFGFGSFSMISIDAGHISKVRCIAMVAPCIAGVIVAFNGRILTGAALLALALGMQIRWSHLQITYYTFLLIGLTGGFMVVKNILQKNYMPTLKAIGAIVLAAGLAVGSNITSLLVTNEYSKETIRGEKSELTAEQKERPEGGLDTTYAFAWSYGKAETFTLIVPYFMGGASGEKLGSESNLAKKGIPKRNLEQIPTYWGVQPFTAGPTYFGIVLVFLFLLGLFIVKEPIRWLFLGAAILTMMMSWGKHLMWFNFFLFEHLPYYNKFRTPSMTLSITNVLMALMGGLAIAEIFKQKPNSKQVMNALKYAGGGLAALLIFLALFSSSLFDFEGGMDAQLRENGWPVEALIKDRQAMLQSDAWRSLLFLVLGVSVLFLWISDKIKPWLALPAIGLLLLVDNWTVSSRYLNEKDFISKSKYESNFLPSRANLQILQDTSYYRVLDISAGDPFRSAEASLFHKSVGGYHAAKLRRYQELIEHQILPNLYNLSKGFGNDNIPVINMLNTKYFIGKESSVIPNPNAMGPAWFVEEVKMVPNGDEEINSLSSFDPGKTAFVNAKFESYMEGFVAQRDTTATLRFISYDPEKLVYESESATEQFAVFSEIYYDNDKGWNATINGHKADYVRVNYVLRGMRIPAGKHRIEFEFKPKTYYRGENISLAASSLLLIGVVLAGYFQSGKERKKQKNSLQF